MRRSPFRHSGRVWPRAGI